MVSHYELAWARRDLQRWETCDTPEGPVPCPVYSPFAAIVVGAVPQPPGALEGDSLQSPMPSCEPGLGGVCYWKSTAVDIFGNRSDAPCPISSPALPEGYND
jgi:hypothetical protein